MIASAKIIGAGIATTGVIGTGIKKFLSCTDKNL